MMKNKVLWILTFLPMIITVIAIRFMEDKVPMHYDMVGNVDRYGSKYEKLIFPIFIILLTLFWSLFLRYFRKKQIIESDEKAIKEAQINEKVIYYVAVGMTILFTLIHCFTMFSSIIETKKNMNTMFIDINVVVNVLLGIFLIVFGNIMPKCKKNSIVGLRTSWSMQNDKTWAVSNRFAGVSLMISGLLIIIESILFGGIMSTIIMLGIIILDGVVSAIYSYKIYKKLSQA